MACPSKLNKILWTRHCYLREAPFTFTISSASWNLPSLQVMVLINKSTQQKKTCFWSATHNGVKLSHRSYRGQFGEIEWDELWECGWQFDTLLTTTRYNSSLYHTTVLYELCLWNRNWIGRVLYKRKTNPKLKLHYHSSCHNCTSHADHS